MRIGGYQKTSLIDFPGKIAAVVFTQGCGWRCPYCHNRSLIHPPSFQPAIPEEEIYDHLKLRQGQLDGVVVSGGEPTLQHGLTEFLRQVRYLGFATKLDTNGSRPNILSLLLQEELLDYIAMDVKGPLDEYTRFTGCDVDTGSIELSIELIKQSGIACEFRTTLVGGLHTREHIARMAPLIHGVRRYALQSYRMPPESNRVPYSPPEPSFVTEASDLLRNDVEELVVR